MTTTTQVKLEVPKVRVGRVCLAAYKEVLLDCDGVLLDFFRAALKQLGADTATYPRNNYNIAEVLGMSQSDFWAKLDNATFWNSVPAFAGSDAFLRTLYTTCTSCGATLVFCTRSSNNVAAFSAARVKALRNLCRAAGIAADLPVYICYNGGKGVFSGPGKLLIDDHDKYLCDFEVAGGDTLKVPMHWNTPVWGGPDSCKVGFVPDYRWLTEQAVRMIAREGVTL